MIHQALYPDKESFHHILTGSNLRDMSIDFLEACHGKFIDPAKLSNIMNAPIEEHPINKK